MMFGEGVAFGGGGRGGAFLSRGQGHVWGRTLGGWIGEHDLHVHV